MNYVPQINRRAFIVNAAAFGGGLALGVDLPFGPDVVRAVDGAPEATAWVVDPGTDDELTNIARTAPTTPSVSCSVSGREGYGGMLRSRDDTRLPRVTGRLAHTNLCKPARQGLQSFSKPIVFKGPSCCLLINPSPWREKLARGSVRALPFDQNRHFGARSSALANRRPRDDLLDTASRQSKTVPELITDRHG